MALPTPDRNLPDTEDTGPPGPTGAAYADEVAAEVERIWELVPNVLVNVAGSANAITAQCDPPLIADIVHGQRFWLIPIANNAAGGVTLDVDTRGAVAVVAYDDTALEEDDLVAGEGTELVGFVSGSPAVTELRLTHPTARQLLASASAGASGVWEQIGDSGNLGTVANVEFTFTPDRYSKVVVVASDLANAAVGSLVATCTLRHSGGAIVTINSSDTGGVNVQAVTTFSAEFAIGIVNPNNRHIGDMMVFIDPFSGTGFTPVTERTLPASGSNATSPDRVRVNFNSNIVNGRVMAYGLLATVP